MASRLEKLLDERKRELNIELAVTLGSAVVLAGLFAFWIWFSASHEAAAFNRVTTGPKVTTWDAVWLDLRVEAR